MEIYKCKQNSNESGLAFLYRFLNVNANTEAKILRPRDLITLFIEKLNPQYLAKFRNFRFRDMDELKEVMADFDRERKEIVSNERIKAKISILSDFEREETDNQEPVPKVDMAALVAEKLFAMMGNSWEHRRGDTAGSGRGQGRGQSNKGSRGQQPAEIHGNRLAVKCHYCHKEGHYARDCFKKSETSRTTKDEVEVEVGQVGDQLGEVAMHNQ
jgi:hypothetical protein